MINKKLHDYLRFFKYLLLKIYPIIVITIKKINAIFISVLVPASKKNTLKQSIRIHKEIKKIKRTSTACSGVLIIAGTNTTISQNLNHLFCFNIFGGYLI